MKSLAASLTLCIILEILRHAPASIHVSIKSYIQCLRSIAEPTPRPGRTGLEAAQPLKLQLSLPLMTALTIR